MSASRLGCLSPESMSICAFCVYLLLYTSTAIIAFFNLSARRRVSQFQELSTQWNVRALNNPFVVGAFQNS